MSLIATQPLHQQYQDLSGEPLESGYLYFGTENLNPETSPITVYWDAAQTQPAAQPIRTSGGYPVRNGKIANIYAAANYSLTVKNKNDQLVYSERTSANSVWGWIISIFSGSTGSSLIGFIQAGVGAILRTVQAKLREEVSMEDFGLATTNTPAQNSAAAEAAMGSGAKRIKVTTPGTYVFMTDIARTCTNITPSEQIRCAIMPRPGQELIVDAGVVLEIEPWVSEGGGGPGQLIFALQAHGFTLSGRGKLLGNWVYGVAQPGRNVLSSQHNIHIASCRDVTIRDIETTGAWTDGWTVSYYGDQANCFNSDNINIINVNSHDNQRCQGSGVGWKNGSIVGGEAVMAAGSVGTSPYCGIDFEPNIVTLISDAPAVCSNIRVVGLHTKGNGYGIQHTCAAQDRITNIAYSGCVIEDGVDWHVTRYCSFDGGVVKRLLDEPVTSNPVSAFRIRDSNYNSVTPGMISDSRKHGVDADVDSDYNLIAPKFVVSCSQETTNTYSGIYVAGEKNMISPSKIFKGAGGAVNKYGIEIAATGVSNYILPADLTDAGQTGELLDGGSDTISMIVGPTQGRLKLGASTDIQWGKAEVAPGAGGAATLSTINNGGGPATNAQAGWERVVNSAGTVRWIPVWS